MKKAKLFAVALAVLSASVAQAADRFQINTVLTIDGKSIEQQPAYIDNGETIHYLPDQALELMKAKDPKVKIKDNEKRLVGLGVDITARFSSEGKILLTSKGSYEGFYGYKDSPTAGFQTANFWFRNLSGTKTVELGEPTRYQDVAPKKDGHDAFIIVTVTRI